MVKYVWRTGDASPWSNKKRIGEIDWFLMEKSLISGPALLLIKAWSEIVLLRSIVRKLTYTLGLISKKGGKWKVFDLRSSLCEPFIGKLA